MQQITFNTATTPTVLEALVTTELDAESDKNVSD